VYRAAVVSGLGSGAFYPLSTADGFSGLESGHHRLQKRPATHARALVRCVHRSTWAHAGPPYLILSALGCYDCDDMTHIYVALANEARLQTDRTPYSYPGAVTPLQSDTVVFRSRLFRGRCLDVPTDVLVWFQNARDSSGTWHHSVYRVQVQADTLVRGVVPSPAPTLAATLHRVQSGHCREIPPRDQVEY